MSQGFATTMHLLSTTKNEAAAEALVAALDSPRGPIRQAALIAILARRNLMGHREVFRRLHTLDEQSKQLVREHRDHTAQALRDALLDTDPRLCANGCLAAIWFHEYDLIPALITILEDRSHPNTDTAGKTLLELAELLYAELAVSRDDRRTDPQVIRRHVVGDLERSVTRFGKHRHRQIVEAFLLLARRDNATLAQILSNPHHAAFVVLTDVLKRSTASGVIGLLLSFLDDPNAPMVALTAMAKRSDPEFIHYLLRKIDPEPSAKAKQNLKRIKSIAWIREDLIWLRDLDESQQHAIVNLVTYSGIPRQEMFAMVEWLMKHGRPAGRRAAAEMLAEFHGAEANALAVGGMEDEDPHVRAAVIKQIRHRGVPGALSRLMELVDSPHDVIQEAVRESLAEFTFPRFLAAFDMLDDEVRESTGALVKKIDREAISLLRVEAQSRVRTRRLRAIAIARCIGMVSELEEIIVGLLEDEDHLVRVEAALALSQCDSLDSINALYKAQNDRSSSVREAAQESIAQRAR